jgi:hypothetical protein
MSVAQATKGDMAYQVRSLVRMRPEQLSHLPVAAHHGVTTASTLSPSGRVSHASGAYTYTTTNGIRKQD